VIKSQGIFQILVIEPVRQILNVYYQEDSRAWRCVPEFTQFPPVTDTGWARQGCFAQAVQNFSTFTAILDVGKKKPIWLFGPLAGKKRLKSLRKLSGRLFITGFGITYSWGWTFF